MSNLLRDKIKNYTLLSLSYIRYWSNVKSKNLPISNNYELIFEDDFKTFNHDVWRYGQPWGDFHYASHPNQYYPTDGSGIEIIPDGLKLSLDYEPKTYIKNELPEWRQTDELPDKWIMEYSAALITTKIGFKKGWFEANIKLPKERSLWCAWWLHGFESWPPEIDILEAYTENISMPKEIRHEPNIHWQNKKGKLVSHGRNKFLLRNSTDRFVNYAVHWTDDFVKIYYDGHLVRELTDREFLNYAKGCTMMLVLGQGYRYGGTPYGSDMIVKNVKVYNEKK